MQHGLMTTFFTIHVTQCVIIELNELNVIKCSEFGGHYRGPQQTRVISRPVKVMQINNLKHHGQFHKEYTFF